MGALRTLAAWLGLSSCLTASAAATPLGAPVPGCEPAYATLDPDVAQFQSSQFTVRIIEPDQRVRWRGEYVSKSLPCCRVTRNAVADLASHVQDVSGRILVEDCR